MFLPKRWGATNTSKYHTKTCWKEVSRYWLVHISSLWSECREGPYPSGSFCNTLFVLTWQVCFPRLSSCCLCRSRANTHHTLIFLAWAFWNSKDFTPYDFHQNNIWCDDWIYTFVGCLPSLHLYLFLYFLNLSTSQHLKVFKFITPASCHPCPLLPLVSSHTSKQEAGVDGGCVSRSGRRSRPILWKWLW